MGWPCISVRNIRAERSVEIQNKLLASLKSDDLELLVHQLTEIPIRQGELLEEPGRPLNTFIFRKAE
jgi:hypothetical protein